MNAGLPLVDPTGGFYYVFLTGQPMFRKYDANGNAALRASHRRARDRRSAGRAADAVADAPHRRSRSAVRAADRSALRRSIRRDSCGSSMIVPYTYVYDAHGDKARTVQFSADRRHQPDEPVLHARRPPARDARLLRIRSEPALATGHEDELATKDTKVTMFSVLCASL